MNAFRFSVVVDCTHCSDNEVGEIVSHASRDLDSSREYVLVLSSEALSQQIEASRIRFVVDRGYCDTAPANLGCLVSRGDWFVVSRGHIPAPGVYADVDECDVGKCVVVRRDSREQECVAIRRHYYLEVGGFWASSSDWSRCLTTLYLYAQLDGTLFDTPKHKEPSPAEAAQQVKAVKELIRLNRSMSQSKGLRGSLATLRLLISSKRIPWSRKQSYLRRLASGVVRLRRSQVRDGFAWIRNDDDFGGRRSRLVVRIGMTRTDESRTVDSPRLGIPVYIVCFERVEGLLDLIAWLERANVNRIFLVDNNSTYPPLLRYYGETNHQVLRFPNNEGPAAIWELGIVRALTPACYYIVSDPDVVPTIDCPADAIAYLKSVSSRFPDRAKVGLGLTTDDLPDHYPLKNEVISWERRFRSEELASGVYSADVDTTFALYRPGTNQYLQGPSLRTAFPYLAQHLPWYSNPETPSPEEVYYRHHASAAVTSWSGDSLPTRLQDGRRKNLWRRLRRRM